MARIGGIAAALCAAALLGGCGGGGGDATAPPGSGSGSPSGAPSVAISGTVTFDRVPAVPGIGLDYASTAPSPARGVTVELVSAGSVLASGSTDAAGRFTLAAPAETEAQLRVPATLLRSGSSSWDFRVVNNTSGNALYVLEGAPFDTGTADSSRDLHAASGWDGSGYGLPRAAAPFAILDVVYEAVQLVLEANPSARFPPLAVHWSADNVPSFGSDGRPDLAAGRIGSSFYAPSLGIYLVGAANVDTDEYDRHVIAHEWGHYFEHAFSRSDSIGGPHALGDQLDMRVAFGEGFGNAFSAMVVGDSVYRDAVGPRQSRGFAFDVEGRLPGNQNANPGWFSEESIHELLYDLFDDRVDLARGAIDDLALGFAPLYGVLTGAQREGLALTSIFPFINALRGREPQAAAKIDQLVQAQGMQAIGDDYGSTEVNFGDPESADLQAVYEQIQVNGEPVEVCSLDDFASDITKSVNKLGSRRYLRFTAAAGGHTFLAVATDVPAGKYADPDMVLHRAGPIAIAEGAPSASCESGVTAACREQFRRTLAAGPHVLEVYEWTNTTRDPDYPPIGRTCFTVTVTQP